MKEAQNTYDMIHVPCASEYPWPHIAVPLAIHVNPEVFQHMLAISHVPASHQAHFRQLMVHEPIQKLVLPTEHETSNITSQQPPVRVQSHLCGSGAASFLSALTGRCL